MDLDFKALLLLLSEYALDLMIVTITILEMFPHSVRAKDIILFLIDAFTNVSVNRLRVQV